MFFRNEIRKVLRFPLFWVMIAFCAGLNIFVIADGMSFERIGIQAVNEYVRTGKVPSYDEYNVCVNYDEVKESAYDQYYKDFDIMAFKADIEKMFVTPHRPQLSKGGGESGRNPSGRRGLRPLLPRRHLFASRNAV